MIKHLTIILLFTFCLALNAFAEAPEFPQPTEEHQWLKQFKGEWETHAKSVAYGDFPAMECETHMKSRFLGNYWVMLETTGEMDGVPVHSIQTLGYDPEKKKYIGTWVDSMSHYMFHYVGTVDESGKKLVLEAEGPNMLEPGRTAKYRDSFEFKSPDLVTATSEIQDEDGKWVTFITGESRRKKDSQPDKEIQDFQQVVE